MSKVIVLANGQQVAIDSIDVDIKSPLDSFGKLQVVSPNQIGDYKGAQYLPQFRYDQRVLGNGATISNNNNENSWELRVDKGQVGEAIIQTFDVFLYESAIGMEINFTLVFGDTVGCIQDFYYGGGWGDSNVSQGDANGLGSILTDGFGITSEDNIIYFDLWTSTSGVPIRSKRIPQSQWNCDKLDGTGKSGVTIDWTKSIIGKFIFQYLGYGLIGFGIDKDGEFILAHIFFNVNTEQKPYMSRGSQPMRARILSKGTGSGEGLLKVSCQGVNRFDNDNDRFIGRTFPLARSDTYRTPSNSNWHLLYTARLADGYNYFTIEVDESSVGSDSNAVFDFVFGEDIPISPLLSSVIWTPLFTQNSPIEFFYPTTGDDYQLTVTDQADNIFYRTRGFSATDSIKPNFGGRSTQFTRKLDGTPSMIMFGVAIPSSNRERMSFSLNCVGSYGG